MEENLLNIETPCNDARKASNNIIIRQTLPSHDKREKQTHIALHNNQKKRAYNPLFFHHSSVLNSSGISSGFISQKSLPNASSSASEYGELPFSSIP